MHSASFYAIILLQLDLSRESGSEVPLFYCSANIKRRFSSGMKSDFLIAITQLSAEKNLSREVVLGAVEAALVAAYRKDIFTSTQ